MAWTLQLCTRSVPPGFSFPVGTREGTLPVRGHLAVSGVIWGCHNAEGATGIWWVGAGVSLHILQCTGQSLNKELPHPRSPQRRGWETLGKPWTVLRGKGTLFAEETAEEL